MDRAALKKELRKKLKESRMNLTSEEVKQKSEAIFLHWKKEFSGRFLQLKFIHLFLSIPERNEVDTSFEKEWIEINFPEIKLVVPVVDVLTNSLKHVWVSQDVELVKSRFGIPEPKGQTQIIAANKIDMVLIPLLGFDAAGNRLGYGKGHYDVFLQQTRKDCIKIGLAFNLAKVAEFLPIESHDIQLDYCITESGAIHFQK